MLRDVHADRLGFPREQLGLPFFYGGHGRRRVRREYSVGCGIFAPGSARSLS